MFNCLKRNWKKITLIALALILVLMLVASPSDLLSKTQMSLGTSENTDDGEVFAAWPDRNVTAAELSEMGYTFGSYTINYGNGNLFLNGSPSYSSGPFNVLQSSIDSKRYLFFVTHNDAPVQEAIAPGGGSNPYYDFCAIGGWNSSILSFGSPRSTADLFVDSYDRVYYDLLLHSGTSHRFYLGSGGSGMGGAATAGTVTKPITTAGINNYNPTVGATIYASVAPSGATATYQWYRNGSPIYGATASAYRVTTTDIGSRLSVKATGYGSFKGEATSAYTQFVPKLNQTNFTITSLATATYGVAYNFTSSGGTSSGGVTYFVQNGTGQAISYGNYMVPTKAGTVFVTATKAGDGIYNPISSQRITVTIGKATQTSTPSIVGATSTTTLNPLKLRAQGGNGTGGYKFWIDTTTPYATISQDGTLTPKGITSDKVTVKVWVQKLGDANYNESASKSFTITINKAQQSGLTKQSASNAYYTGLNFTYQALVTGGSGNGAISYSITPKAYGSIAAGAATISGSTISKVSKVGNFEITATKAGTDFYLPTSITFQFAVLPGTQALNVSGVTKSFKYDGTAHTLTGATALDNSTITYIINGNVVTSITDAGTHTITATAAKTNLYAAATKTFTVTVAKANQSTLTINSKNNTVFGTPLTLTTSGGSGTGTISYVVTNGTGKASISGTTLTPISVGTVTVTATRAGDNNYNPVSATATITITAKNITATGTSTDFTLNAPNLFVGETLSVTKNDSAILNETYKWFASEDGTTWTEITGETASTYEIRNDDLNKTIKVEITATGNHTGTVPIETTSPISYNIIKTDDVVSSEEKYTLTENGSVTFTYKNRTLTVTATAGTKIILSTPTLFDSQYPSFNFTIEPTDSEAYQIKDWTLENTVISTNIIYSLATGTAQSNAEAKPIDFTFVVKEAVAPETIAKTIVKSYTPGEKFTDLPTPFLTGKVFEGWFKEATFTNKIETTETVPGTSNISYYAKWYDPTTPPTDPDPTDPTVLSAAVVTWENNTPTTAGELETANFNSIEDAISFINAGTFTYPDQTPDDTLDNVTVELTDIVENSDITISLNGYVFGNTGTAELTNPDHKLIITSADTTTNKIIISEELDFNSVITPTDPETPISHTFSVANGATLEFKNVEFAGSNITVGTNGTLILKSGVEISKDQTLITSNGTVNIEEGVTVSPADFSKVEKDFVKTAVAKIESGTLNLNMADVTGISRNFAINLGNSATINLEKEITTGYLIITEIDSGGTLVEGGTNYTSKTAITGDDPTTSDTVENNISFGRVKVTNSGITLAQNEGETELVTTKSTAIHAVRVPNTNDPEFTLGYESLQAAIAAADTGETIHFVRRISGETTTGDIYEESITIPAGKNITITSGLRAVSGDYGTVVTVITADSGVNTNTLKGKITVEKGAILTLTDVILKGEYSGTGTTATSEIENAGTLILENVETQKITNVETTTVEPETTTTGKTKVSGKIIITDFTSPFEENGGVKTYDPIILTKALTEGSEITISNDITSGSTIATGDGYTLSEDDAVKFVITNMLPTLDGGKIIAKYLDITLDAGADGTFIKDDQKVQTITINQNFGGEITLPENVPNPTKPDHKFVGWSKDDDNTVDENLILTTDKVSIYAVWEEKAAVQISTDPQTGNTYTGIETPFEIKGTEPNIEPTSFTISYAQGDFASLTDSSWSTTAPTNAGSYHVRITRPEDETDEGKASLDEEIENGLIINKATLNVTLSNFAHLYGTDPTDTKDIPFEMSFVGFENGETLESFTALEGTDIPTVDYTNVSKVSETDETFAPGNYSVNLKGGVSTNYDFTFGDPANFSVVNLTLPKVSQTGKTTEDGKNLATIEINSQSVGTFDYSFAVGDPGKILTEEGLNGLTFTKGNPTTTFQQPFTSTHKSIYAKIEVEIGTTENSKTQTFYKEFQERILTVETKFEEPTDNQIKATVDTKYFTGIITTDENGVETKTFVELPVPAPGEEFVPFPPGMFIDENGNATFKNSAGDQSTVNVGKRATLEPTEEEKKGEKEETKTITLVGDVNYYYNLVFESQGETGTVTNYYGKWQDVEKNGNLITFENLSIDIPYRVVSVNKIKIPVDPGTSGIIPGTLPTPDVTLEVKDVKEVGEEGTKTKTITIVGDTEHFYNVYHLGENGEKVYVSNPWKDVSENGDEITFEGLDINKEYFVIAIEKGSATIPPDATPDPTIDPNLPKIEVKVEVSPSVKTPTEDSAYLIVDGKFGYEYNLSFVGENDKTEYFADSWRTVTKDGEKIYFTNLTKGVEYTVEKRPLTPLTAKILVTDKTDASITIQGIAGYEYNLTDSDGAIVSGSKWQQVSENYGEMIFTGLEDSTTYSFVARKLPNPSLDETLPSVQSQQLYPSVTTLEANEQVIKDEIKRLIDAIENEIYPAKSVDEIDKTTTIPLTNPDETKTLIDVITEIKKIWNDEIIGTGPEPTLPEVADILKEEFEKVIITGGIINLKDMLNEYPEEEYYTESENKTHNYQMIEEIYEKALEKIVTVKTQAQADEISTQANAEMDQVKRIVEFLKEQKFADIEKLSKNYIEENYTDDNWKLITNTEPKGIIETARETLEDLNTLEELENFKVFVREETTDVGESIQSKIEAIETIPETNAAAAEKWKKDNKTILDKTLSEIDLTDKTAIEKAIEEYVALVPAEIQNLLLEERADLQEKLEKITELELEEAYKDLADEESIAKWKEDNKDIIIKDSFTDGTENVYGKDLSEVVPTDKTAIEKALEELNFLKPSASEKLKDEKVDLEIKLWVTENEIITKKIEEVTIADLTAVEKALETLPDITKEPIISLPDEIKAKITEDIAEIETDLIAKKNKINELITAADIWKKENKDIILKGSYEDGTDQIFGKTLEEVVLTDLGSDVLVNTIKGALKTLETLTAGNESLANSLAAEKADLQLKLEKLLWLEENKTILTKPIKDVKKSDLGTNTGTEESPTYPENSINKALDSLLDLPTEVKNPLIKENQNLEDKKKKVEFLTTHETIIEKTIEQITGGENFTLENLKVDITTIKNALEELKQLPENVQTGLEKEKADLTKKLDAALAKEWLEENKTIIEKVTETNPAYIYDPSDLTDLRDAFTSHDPLTPGAKEDSEVKKAYEKISDILKEQDQATKDALSWKEANAVILTKDFGTIATDDKAHTEKALETFKVLSDDAKALLKKEKENLDKKDAGIKWSELANTVAMHEKSIDQITKEDVAALEKAINDYRKIGVSDGEIFEEIHSDIINKLSKANNHKDWYDKNATIIEEKLSTLTKEDLPAVQKALAEFTFLSKSAQDIETVGPGAVENEGLFPKPNLDKKLNWALTLSQSFKVVYELGGGNFPAGAQQMTQTTVYYGQPAPLQLTNPEKAGYEFAGWFKDKNFQTPWNFSYDTVTSQTRIYAKWDVSPIEIKLIDSQGTETIVKVASGTTLSKEKIESALGTENITNIDGYYTDETLKTPYVFSKEVTEPFVLHYKVVTEKFTVTFETNGGSEISQVSDVGYNTTIAEPATTPTKTGSTFVGYYQDKSLSIPWNFEGSKAPTKIKENATIYVKWNIIDSSEITGSIVDSNGDPVTEGLKAELKAGNTVYANVTITSGNFTISSVVNDTYNLVLYRTTTGTQEIIKTIKVVIDGENVDLGKIIMPEILTNSKVETVGDGTPEIVADGVYKIFEGGVVTDSDGNKTLVTDGNFSPADKVALDSGYSVEIVLKGEKKDALSAGGMDLISKITKTQPGLIMDFTLTKTVAKEGAESSSTMITELANLLEIKIPLPEDLKNQSNIVVYRVHNGEVETITQSSANGEFFTFSTDKTSLILHVKKFSTFAVVSVKTSGGNDYYVTDKEDPTPAPEPTPTNPTDPTDPKPSPTPETPEGETTGKEMSVLNLLCLLACVAVSVITLLKKNKFKFATVGLTLAGAILFALTTGFEKVIFANLWSVAFALILLANAALLIFPKFAKKDEVKKNEENLEK